MKVFSPTGQPRISNESWLYSLHSTHVVNFGLYESGTKYVSVPGYDPSNQKWNVVWDASSRVTLTEEPGRLKVTFESGYEQAMWAAVFIMVVRQ